MSTSVSVGSGADDDDVDVGMLDVVGGTIEEEEEVVLWDVEVELLDVVLLVVAGVDEVVEGF